MAEKEDRNAKGPEIHKKLQEREIWLYCNRKRVFALIYIITELYVIFYHMKFRSIAPIVPAPSYSNSVF